MFRIPACMALTIALSFGQENRKIDLERLQDLYKDRDPDGLLAQTLEAFLLPQERAAERNKMLTRLCRVAEFSRFANLAATTMESQPENEEVILGFHEGITSWLEQTDPNDLKNVNLSWVSYGALRFFQGSSNNRFPDLFKDGWREEVAGWETYKKGSIELAERKFSLARRLAISLVKIPSTSEEGFRLLSAAGGMNIPKEEMDAAARIALAVTSDRLLSPSDGDHSFMIRYNDGGSQSENLQKHCSVRWLAARPAVSPADVVIPPAWLAELAETDPGRAELVAAMRERCGSAQLAKLWSPERVETENLGPVTAMLFRQIFARAATISGTESFFAEKLGAVTTRRFKNSPYDNSPLCLLIRGALLTAATSDESGRETLCRLVGRILYGDVVTGDEEYDHTAPHSGEFTMTEALDDWPLDDRDASLRLFATLQRLRIPAGASLRPVMLMFNGMPSLTFDEAEEMLESAGWIQDAPQWDPPRVITRQLRLNSKKQKAMIAEEFLIGRVLVDHPGFDTQRFTARLKERKKGRFGALLFASQLMSPNERDEVILTAFAGMEDEWIGNAAAKMPPFSLITSMMTPEAAAKLPAFLRPAP